jgi:hypothetical protein
MGRAVESNAESGKSKSAPKSVRGVYEHPANSGIWYILYYVDGNATAKRWVDGRMRSLSISGERPMPEWA